MWIFNSRSRARCTAFFVGLLGAALLIAITADAAAAAPAGSAASPPPSCKKPPKGADLTPPECPSSGKGAGLGEAQHIDRRTVKDDTGGVTASTTTCGTTSSPQPAAATTIARAVLSQLNAQRGRHGLPPLSTDLRLVAAARAHNRAMAACNTIAHQLPGELSLAGRILLVGYNFRFGGENVAWNSEMTLTGAQYLQRIMYQEQPPNDGHRLNILSPNYRHVGVHVYFDYPHHKLWLTTDFGSLL